MNALEGLLWKRKNSIMSSIFQNTLYNGQKLCDFLNEKPKTRKKGEDFWWLLWVLSDSLPQYDFPEFIEKKAIFEKYPHLYAAHNGYLINIKELIDYFDGCTGQQEFVVDYMIRGVFRPYHLYHYDKETKTQRIESIYSKTAVSSHPFAKLCHYQNRQEILESLEWSDYEALLNELKELKRSLRQKRKHPEGETESA